MGPTKQPIVEPNDELLSKVRELRQRGIKLGLRDDEIQSLFTPEKNKQHPPYSLWTLKLKVSTRNYFTNKKKRKQMKYGFAALIVLVIAIFLSPSPSTMKEFFYQTFVDDPCLVNSGMFFTEILRPRVPCGICVNMTSVPIVRNISKEEFVVKYAYTGVPVLIKDAISDWKALQSFSYKYLKDLYTGTVDALQHVNDNCQFFGYKTEFEVLDEVFEMTDDRAALKEGTEPWYVGWSNCEADNSKVGQMLRTQYSRPYFLPDDANTMNIDWIFIGGPGHGASLHIDDVERPSWQAQVSGRKTWTLVPSPECDTVCESMQVTVEKGDIIVLNTNIWYHKTEVNPGDISITIGAEYD